MTSTSQPANAAPSPAERPRLRLIGLLGGMSWESTAEYYRLANELVRDRLGGLHSARLVLASLDFAEIEALQVAGEWERAGEILAAEAARLEGAGAEILVLCTNIMHKVADQVQAAVSIPFVHLADVHRIIYDELCRGVILEESRQIYREIIERLVAAGAEGVILGCTEVELLVGQEDSPVPVFPTTRLHVEAALDAALREG